MTRSIRLLPLLPFLLFSGTPALGQEIDGAQPIANWLAPPLWKPAAVRVQAVAHPEAVAAATSPLPLIAISPCRMLDTRTQGGPIASGSTRTITLTGAPCGIPSTAQAVSANFAIFDILGTSSYGVLVVYPAGSPSTSQALVNWGPSSGQIDNASVVPLGTSGAITVSPNQGSGSIDLVIDVNGYYAGSVVTSLTPGTGLTGNATMGDVTLGIAAGAVTSNELAANAVTSSKIAANAVTAGAIAAGQVGTTQLANAAVTKGKLAAAGGTSGQVLATDGSGLLWQAQGLALPYSGTVNSSSAAFAITNTGGHVGVKGTSTYLTNTSFGTLGDYFFGVYGESSNDTGVYGKGAEFGTWGIVGNGAGGSFVGSGVAGESASGYGVFGRSTSGTGIYGDADGSGDGVHGVSLNGPGVHGESVNGDGVFGKAYVASKSGIFAVNTTSGGYAGYFLGDVHVQGNLSASGTKPFRIDHPLDPENRELWHAAVESSEVLNVYSGNIVTDAEGRAVVELPAWFEALNTDFRYQLTVIGQFARAIVEKEIEQNRFVIRTDLAEVKVSWQVTARRNDAWMRAHPFAVEREKPASERGTYLAPREHAQPDEKDVERVRHPELIQGPRANLEKAVVKSR